MINNRLLLIEDDHDIADMLATYFSTHHYVLLHADTGRAGVEMALSQSPALILLDVMLPDMDGFRVCQQIRQMSVRRYVPIIFLTHRHERANKMRGLALAADDYITKPFDVDELRLRVQSAIQRANRTSQHDVRTGLPTWTLVLEEIARRQKANLSFVQVRLALTGFHAYSEIYGFLAADDVLSFTAQVIHEVIAREGSPRDFVGIDDEQFVILTPPAQARRLIDGIIHAFNEGVKPFYSFQDIEHGGLTVNASTAAPEFVPLMQLKAV